MDNLAIARVFAEIGDLLEIKNENPFKIRAYRNAADTIAHHPDRVASLPRADRLQLPGVGKDLAAKIGELVDTGVIAYHQELLQEFPPTILDLLHLQGVGPKTVALLYHHLGIRTLEELEAAAHDGRLAEIGGFGEKRIAGVRDSLAGRLGRARKPASASPSEEPAVSEILDVDREYRMRAGKDELPKVTPRRFNPKHEAWLPVLHTARGDTNYTALYSNTARAHELGTTDDWVVIYRDDQGGSGQWTVVTATDGPLSGKRVVRGRELEMRRYYAGDA